MKESPPATASPEQTAASEETVAQEQRPRREGWRVRVPTSVLVTVTVAALSVWVAPAFTRQWDDRQKARELRVAITEDVITKGTRVIYVATKPPLPGYKPAADYDAVFAQWNEDSAILSAKLRAYFPQEVSDRWNSFSNEYARRLLRVAARLPAAQKRHAGKTRQQVARLFTDGFHLNLDDRSLLHDVDEFFRPTLAVREQWMPQLVILIREEEPADSFRGYMQDIAVAELQQLTDELLSAHLTGFSTTRRDFLRDLLP